MPKPIVRIHDLATDEVIDREMTDAEFAQYQADKKLEAIETAALETKIQAKTELLERLGITEDEAKLLLV